MEVTKDQQHLLNPTVLDTITGFILKDSQGESAKKRLNQRRLNMTDATISSHCCTLNDPEQMKLVQKKNQIEAILAEIELDKIKTKEKNKKEKAAKEAEKAKRKKIRLEKNKEKEKQEKEEYEKAM